tara:strand:- start:190 stop:768 length:579 start_codon:yes stop_codon:yes gene_type:complete
MASDRRVTAGGQIVVQKNMQKTIRINDYLLMAISGSASDAKMLANILSAELRLKELTTKSRPSVEESANLLAHMSYKNIRTPSMIPPIVGSIVGGFNEDGSAELFTIEPAGGIDKIQNYDANFSSGMPYILGLLEGKYNENITVKEGLELAKEAIQTGIERDPASGNGIDVFSVTKSGIKHEVSQKIVPQYK